MRNLGFIEYLDGNFQEEVVNQGAHSTMKILVFKGGGGGGVPEHHLGFNISHMDRLVVVVVWHPYFIGGGGIKLVHKILKFSTFFNTQIAVIPVSFNIWL